MDIRTQIITTLWNSKSIMRSISIAANGKSMGFEDELKSYLFTYLCEMPEEKILGLHERGELNMYVNGIIKNQITHFGGGVNGTIQYVPRRMANEIGEDSYLPDLLQSGVQTDDGTGDIKDAIKRLNWFQRYVIEQYIELGSVNEIAKHTGASKEYISKMLKSARKKLSHALR